MNFLSLKATNQDQPTHSTDRETETQGNIGTRPSIKVRHLFIGIAVPSGCRSILCSPRRAAEASVSRSSYNPGQAPDNRHLNPVHVKVPFLLQQSFPSELLGIA